MRPALVLLVLLALGLPVSAGAHQLKLFATVEAGTVSGYGFFVGGGRAATARVSAAAGEVPVVAGLPVEADGSFAFPYDGPGPLRLVLDAGEGHRAEAILGADRFAVPGAGEGLSSTIDADALAELIEARVEAAVARQTRPLLEALAEAEARLRFSDIMAGIGMITGIAGAALWVAARRRGGGS